jgi:prepilin-type N-terminal cleavage/methylation domain-containing protein
MNRRGFTLIEVIIAMTILVVIVLAMSSAAGQFVRLTSQSEAHAVASQLTQERLQLIQMDPNYAGLETTYEGTESTIPGATGFARETDITRVGGGTATMDFKRVTVTVTGPGLTDPVVRTTTVAAP